MSTGYQIDDQYTTYFITSTIVNWVDIFSRKVYRDIMVDSLNYCIKEKQLSVYAYVIMTNHIHLMVRSKSGKLSDTIRDMKKFTAKQILAAINKEPESRRDWLLDKFAHHATIRDQHANYQVWIHNNHAECIYSEKFIHQKMNYIHENPVRAGWVEMPEEYIYSSAKTVLYNKPGLVNITPWGE